MLNSEFALFSTKSDQHMKQTQSPPFWGDVCVKKWSPLLDSGARSPIFGHLKLPKVPIFRCSKMEISPLLRHLWFWRIYDNCLLTRALTFLYSTQSRADKCQPWHFSSWHFSSWLLSRGNLSDFKDFGEFLDSKLAQSQKLSYGQKCYTLIPVL